MRDAESDLFVLRDVRQRRGGRTLLDGIQLSIAAGLVTALVGPSGGGKTSLLRLLNRLDDPVSGTIELDGRPIGELPVRELRRRVGFVFQQPTMFAGTVADNLCAGLEFVPPGEERPRGRADVEEVLSQVGLDPSFASRDAAVLSGGEQQRVSIGRALMTRPAALLLDEPTSGLDPEVADHLIATVTGLSRAKRLTIVMVTHRLAEARAASRYTVMLEAGRVVEAGPTETLFRQARQARTRAYLASG